VTECACTPHRIVGGMETFITTGSGAIYHYRDGRFRRTDHAAPVDRGWGVCRLVTARVGEPARFMMRQPGTDVWAYRVTEPVVSIR